MDKINIMNIMDSLVDHYKDEIEDVHEYAQLAEEVEAMGDEKLAKHLYTMAKQEYEHAHTLRKALMGNYGYKPCADHETEKKWLAIKHL